MASVVCDRSSYSAAFQSTLPAVLEFTLNGSPVFIDALCTKLVVKNRVLAQLQNSFFNQAYAISFGDGPSDIEADFHLVNTACIDSANSVEAIREGFPPLTIYQMNRFLPEQLFRQNAWFRLSINAFHINCVLLGSLFDFSTREAPATSVKLLFRGFPA